MQAVILAAGKGTRMSPLGAKPLLKIAGKTILEHNLSALEGIEEVIIVVGHRGKEVMDFLEKIKKQFNFTISTVEQKDSLGTYHALLQARPLLKDTFLVMNGDDLYHRQDMVPCLKDDLSILAREVSDPSRFGILESEKGFLKKIVEKPASPESNLANTGLFVLDEEIFLLDVKKSPRGEWELTDAVNMLAQKRNVVIQKSSGWLPIGYPWDLLEANEAVLKNQKGGGGGEVEKNVVLKNSVFAGKNTLIRSGAYIEGPVFIGEDCVIGPNCYIRSFTSIGNDCKIGNGVEVKNCVIGDHVSIGHLSYFGDSILGNNINIGAGTIAANLRHDQQTIKVKVNGKLVDTRRRKFGCIIGDRVHTGIHTTLYPGRKLSFNTLPGEIVREDK